MVESFKYKSKIATAIAFIAMIIVSLGKDGLAQIIPEEYIWLIPVLTGVASWILAQKTEDHRVVVAEQKAIEDYKNEFENDVDPTINEDEILTYDDADMVVGDENEGC